MMRRPALVIGLALLAGGCSHSPPTQYYVLAPATPASTYAEPYAGEPIWIAAVNFPPEYDRPELVDNQGSSELVLHDFAHWAAPVGELARKALTEDLMARLPPGRVVSSTTSTIPHRDIVVDILSLRREGDVTVLDVTWTLSPEQPALSRPGTSVTADLAAQTARLSEKSASPGPRGQTEVLGRLLGRTADSIALALARSNSSRSGSGSPSN